MTARDEQVLRDIIGALSSAIVELCRSIEKQQPVDFSRQPVIVALRNVATNLPADSENREMIKTILENMARELESGNQSAVRVPIGKK